MRLYVPNFPLDSWKDPTSRIFPKVLYPVILKSFERIDLKKFTDILQNICYGISGADFEKKKKNHSQ